MHSDQREAQLLEPITHQEQYSVNEPCDRFGATMAMASLTRKMIVKSDRVIAVGDNGKMGGVVRNGHVLLDGY